MWLVEQPAHRALEPGLLELEDALRRALRRRARGLHGPARDLLEGIVEIDPRRLARELPHRREVRHDEACRRLRPRVAREEPGEQAVVELEVGGEVLAAYRGAAEGLDEP